MASQKRVHWAQLRVGVVSTIAMIIAAVLIFLLSGKGNLFQGEVNLRTYMEDSAGIAENAEVRLNGIYIGHIHRVQLSGSHDPRRTVEIQMKVASRYINLIP